MTVDQAGAIWLAGRKALVQPDQFPEVRQRAPATALAQAPTYCAQTFVTDWPVIADLAPIDGDSGSAFNFGSGTLGVERATP
jgi:hypothetical protein